MRIYPAVDIYNGKCVRLKEGKLAKMEMFYENPLDAAKMWEQKGAKALHIIDLNGAFDGKMGNSKVIEKIIGSVSIPVQVGGGLRNVSDIKEAFNTGAARVIIGTAAVLDDELLETGLKEYINKMIVSIDAKDGNVAINGWVNISEFSAYNFAYKIVGKGFRNIVYTDISRDGSMSGPNFDGIEKMCNVEGAKIIASGGITSIDDIIAIKDAGAEGAIIGKALYAGILKLEDAIKAAED
ncbi:MAG TPA: 1-(5-phosphoribosyl)-5-[(5-phosphoribosylamino)methylideneamino]imidazole-4-carboxamide isomerase [Bacillota bacterium]|nr:1-(5-phosphoribosyl)-5-[(5-phosphoribosylamino)methylideneamino]imidazole-4-carboxamide isomerase [Bacillota bacterium]HRS20906.1 1-(5-phosphoribosyl)-5-[(5-phosphoribosylamino)methylideneamino]imidazole-4-carboxamide isomerase [Clostridia bacterium]